MSRSESKSSEKTSKKSAKKSNRIGELSDPVTAPVVGKNVANVAKADRGATAVAVATPISVFDADLDTEIDNNDLVTISTGDISGDHSETNSGIIWKSQFVDGGFGDIGQQWKCVKLKNSSVNNHHTSINVTVPDGGTLSIKGDSLSAKDSSSSSNSSNLCEKCKKPKGGKESYVVEAPAKPIVKSTKSSISK